MKTILHLNSNVSSCVVLITLFISCNQQSNTKNTTPFSSGDTTITATLKSAYIYGLPLVIMDITRRQMMDSSTDGWYVAPNTFRHNSAFPDASFRTVVRPNADTYYSIALLDITEEPVVLSVPNTKGRYYMMPILDAYTNVFASPGTRTTGNGAGNFVITGPKWSGSIPTNMKKIKSPTNTAWLIGRTQVNSQEDGIKNVVPLQKKYTLTLLSKWGKPLARPLAPPPNSPAPQGDPNSIVRNMPIVEYFNYMNELLMKNPPPITDHEVMMHFEKVGVGAGKVFNLKAFPAENREVIANIPKEIFAAFDKEKNSSHKLANGWNIGRKIIGTYGTDYLSRASTAYFGLGANLREDAIYPYCTVDGDGNTLNGTHAYVMHFEKGKTPPVHAFWSLTLYDDEGYFTENVLKRYTVGDRSNLQENRDGSIDIYIQHKNPGKNKESNWLPAPAGNFNLLLRAYWPKEEMLNEQWTPPAVVNVD